MSLFSRRLVIVLAGAAAGLLAWPLSELLLSGQADFPSYLLFIVASGALFGGFFGLAFGSVDGIAGGVAARKWLGLLTGALFGLLAGGIGALAGQALFLAIGQVAVRAATQSRIILPIARGLGWSIMGVIIGFSEGARLRSLKRALIGALGGLVGGLAGGLIIEYGSVVFSSAFWVRPVASVVLGVLLAAGFAAIDRGFLLGTLVLVTGALRGREYPLPPGRTTIGHALGDTISLLPYSGVADRHAVIVGNRKGLVLNRGPGGEEIKVNEDSVEQLTLKYDDVIDIGSARFFLKTR